MSEPSNSSGKARPFPWYCSKCRRKEVRRVTMPYQFSQTYNGQTVTVSVPDLAVPKCSHCGELTFDYEADDQLRKAFAAMVAREKLSQNVVLGGSTIQQPHDSHEATRSKS